MIQARVRYQTLEVGAHDIHLRTLWDTQSFADDALSEGHGISAAQWPLFGVVWAAGRMLAHVMLDHDIDGRRILEVGCGMGLASLVLNRRQADITASDHHPEAGRFLAHNVALNEDAPIPFFQADWRDVEEGLLGRFDLVIGSDVLYERGQAQPLARFIDGHTRATAEVVIVDGRRGQLGAFRRAMAEHGFTCEEMAFEQPGAPAAPCEGRVYQLLR